MEDTERNKLEGQSGDGQSHVEDGELYKLSNLLCQCHKCHEHLSKGILIHIMFHYILMSEQIKK